MPSSGRSGENPARTPAEATGRRLSLRGAFTVYLRGALMGLADVIPGVSGGTVALVVGVYERLIEGLRTLFAVPGGFLRSGLGEGLRVFRLVPWPFLFALGLGILSALLVGARVIPPLYERWTMQANALFFGLILGSVAVPWHRIEVRRGGLYMVAAAAGVLAFLLAGLPRTELGDPPLGVVMAGAAVAITAMVLPGVSGAYILHAFGLWVPTLEAVNTLNVTYLGVFAVGLVVGTVFIVYLVSWLLRRAHDLTLAALVGLMIGALRALWPWMDEAERAVLPEVSVPVLLVPLLLIAGGYLLVRGADHWARTKESRRWEKQD